MWDAWLRGAGILAGFSLVISIFACGGGPDHAPPPPSSAAASGESAGNVDGTSADEKAVRELDAMVLSEKAVRQFLKFPHDASFGWTPSVYVDDSGNVFSISSTVKAKNALGAELTHEWSTVIEFIDGEPEVAQLMIGDEVVYRSKRLEALFDSEEDSDKGTGGQRMPRRPTQRRVPIKAEAELRTWTDDTGEHRVEARFVSAAMGQVKLRKEDGSEVSLPIERLSEADQEWLRRRARR